MRTFQGEQLRGGGVTEPTESTPHNVDLSFSVHRTLAEYGVLQNRISNKEIDFKEVYDQKLTMLHEDGQFDLSEFMHGMYSESVKIDRIFAERMCFGGFYAYESLQGFSRRKGRDLPVIVISEEQLTSTERAEIKFGALIANRPDLAEITNQLTHESSTRGAMAVILCFQHLFKRK